MDLWTTCGLGAGLVPAPGDHEGRPYTAHQNEHKIHVLSLVTVYVFSETKLEKYRCAKRPGVRERSSRLPLWEVYS